MQAKAVKYFAKALQKKELQSSENACPKTEEDYRTHYISSTLSTKKWQKLQEKLEKPPEHIVFSIITDSQCSQCNKELHKGNFLYKTQDNVLCMTCAGFGDLVFLPSGDMQLTRYSKKHSKKSAIVVKFSRARKRYERPGILSALQKAKTSNTPPT